MRLGDALHKALLAISMVGIVAGATCLSDGMCGGGGGGGYQSSPAVAAR